MSGRIPAMLAMALVLGLATFVGGQVKPAKGGDAKPPVKAEAAALKFEIGKETTIDDASLEDGHFILYVPKDYTPDRAWPLIFCYHGVNQSAKVWPFKELTDGKGFIVVGMSYIVKNGSSTDKEWESMQRIGQQVAATLKVNPKMIFIGGFSLGGGWTYRLSAKDPAMFAGVIAFGMSGGPGTSAPEAWRGKPVLVAHGEKDEYCQKIEGTVEAYNKVGAALTHEVFKGQGHTVDTRNEVCRKWLLDNGPLKAVKGDLEAAQAVEKSGKLGAALAMYEAIARTEGGDHAAAATAAAKSIADSAEKKLTEAEALVTAKKYADAVKTLVAVEKLYSGSSIAAKAKGRLDQIQNDPEIKATIEQARIDAAADAMEALAQGAEKAKDFGRAISIYEKYVTEHPKAARFAQVKQRLDELKADKTITSGIVSKQIETECKSWLSMAENYARSGMNDKAKTYLQKVIDKYPGTPYAATAKQKMGEIR